jgi:hypothetical protein
MVGDDEVGLGLDALVDDVNGEVVAERDLSNDFRLRRFDQETDVVPILGQRLQKKCFSFFKILFDYSRLG